MKTDILDIEISCFQSYHIANNPKPISLRNWLQSEKYKDAVLKIRTLKDKAKIDKLKARLPCITPSGLFSQSRAEKNLIAHSGFIQFDIDFKENKHISNYSALKTQICNLSNVAFCALSVSGNGYWGLIPIADKSKHKSHFRAIKKAFIQFGIVLDNKPQNVASLRGYSYDENAFFNDEAEIFTLLEEAKPKTIQSELVAFNPSNTFDFTQRKVEFCLSEISSRKINITDGYDIWFRLGCSFSNTFGESGRSYFHSISQYSSQYDTESTDKEFDKCKKYQYSQNDINTFFYQCKKFGISYMGMFKK